MWRFSLPEEIAPVKVGEVVLGKREVGMAVAATANIAMGGMFGMHAAVMVASCDG